MSVRKVSQVIPGGQQEGEHGVVHQVQRGHYDDDDDDDNDDDDDADN